MHIGDCAFCVLTAVQLNDEARFLAQKVSDIGQ